MPTDALPLRPIALLTDFGTRDPYVAAMKGVIAARTRAPVIDLTHEIAPFDVFGAAWFLRAIVGYWPAETIFVCVVDPGVGSARDIIAMERDGRVFLAPDNGLLSLLAAEGDAAIHIVNNEGLFLPQGSNTFHGRDRFAPVAAAIASGVPIHDVGPRAQAIVELPYDPPVYGDDVVRGTVVSVDRFGNLITDIVAARIHFKDFEIRADGVTIDRMQRSYAEAGTGPFMIIGSSGSLEISIANDSAAARLQMRRLQRVAVWPTARR